MGDRLAISWLLIKYQFNLTPLIPTPLIPVQGAVAHEHLEYYLDEYTFRFNRRTSRYRGKLFYRLLQQAVATDVVTYETIKKSVRGQKPTHHI